MSSDSVLFEKPVSLPQRIAAHLTKRIEDQEFRPGDILPTEKQLAETLGVSRSVIREAVSIMKYDGLVDTRQGSGVYVSSKPKMSFRVRSEKLNSQQELHSLFQLRMYVETGAAELAAIHRSKIQLKLMKTCLDRMAAEISVDRAASSKSIEADLAFHAALSESTGNLYFHEFSQFLISNLRMSVEAGRRSSSTVEGRARQVLEEHIAIYEAVKSGSVQKAGQAARQHVLNAALRLGLSIEPVEGATHPSSESNSD